MFIVMMTKKGSTEIVTFITPVVRVVVLGCGRISHIVNVHYFFKFFSTPRHRSDKLNI